MNQLEEEVEQIKRATKSQKDKETYQTMYNQFINKKEHPIKLIEPIMETENIKEIAQKRNKEIHQMNPEYRIRIEIYDDSVGEVVTKIDQPMYSGEVSNTPIIYRALNSFVKDRDLHESTHHPKEIEWTEQ